MQKKKLKLGSLKLQEVADILKEGSVEGKPHTTAPPGDSRNNRVATRSLTQLIINNRAQPLTYAFPLNSHCPFCVPHPPILSIFSILISLVFHVSEFPFVFVSFSDSRRSRMRLLIISPPVLWSPRSPPSPPGPLCFYVWECCHDGWEEMWSCLHLLGPNRQHSHTQQPSSRRLPITAKGLWLLSPFITKATIKKRGWLHQVVANLKQYQDFNFLSWILTF